MKKQTTKLKLKSFFSFRVKNIAFTKEQIDAICKRVPMTMDLFDDIIHQSEKIGPNADRVFYSMLEEYPDFMVEYANKIDKEMADVDLPILSEKKQKIIKEKIYDKLNLKE